MSIIHVTDAAIQHIQKLLKDKPKTTGFRLSVKKTGCSGYMYVTEVVNCKHEHDITMLVLDCNIYIDHACAPLILGTTMDYVKKGLGSQLVFNNPNAEGACGCGESFNLKE